MASLDMNKTDVYLQGIDELYIRTKSLRLNQDETD